MMRWLWVIAVFLLQSLRISAEAGTPQIFFALGQPFEQESRKEQVFKVEAQTKQILATSPPFARQVRTAVLSGDHSRIFVLDVDNRVTALATEDLRVLDQFQIPLPLRNTLFAHPRTGILYLGGGVPPSDGAKSITVFDPAKKSVIKTLRAPPGELFGGPVLHDPKDDRLYVLGTKIWVVNPHKHEIAELIDYEGSQKNLGGFTDFLLLPKNRKLLIMTEVMFPELLGIKRPIFFVYDLEKKGLFLRSEPFIEVRRLRSLAVSRDERKLFATSTVQAGKSGSGVIIEMGSMHVPSEIQAHLAFPEPVDHFVPAPDSRGMWMIAKSGKVYRLDEDTGQVLEEVPLPFRFRKVIASP